MLVVGLQRVTQQGHTHRCVPQGECKTVDHWERRKHLLLELEFLTQHGHKASTVIYIGAAPGSHMFMLANTFFPQVPEAFFLKKKPRRIKKI